MVDVSNRKNMSKIFCQKRLFSEFGPLEIRLKYEKYEIVEDIHTNCVVHFEKLSVSERPSYEVYIR